MKSILIQKVNTNEVEALKEIGKLTFSETFSSTNSAEDMEIYLSNSFSTAKVTEELNHPNSVFYFAKEEQKIIGYLKLNFEDSQTELKDNNAVEIERIYVLQEYHGKKVGQSLYDKAIEVAKEKEANYVWLGVWEKNPRAIQFYTKNGFKEFDRHLFKLGNDEQIDLMMKLFLNKK